MFSLARYPYFEYNGSGFRTYSNEGQTLLICNKDGMYRNINKAWSARAYNKAFTAGFNSIF